LIGNFIGNDYPFVCLERTQLGEKVSPLAVNKIYIKRKKTNPKIHMEAQKIQIAKAILNRVMLEVSQYLSSSYTTEL
jgi:hypothetical protein